ncbi:MAG: hypothetical protein JOZ53_11465 [Planctomycetaceae bacterium]|nr:hypothetical protein [Planctomycetaceae bacterium]
MFKRHRRPVLVGVKPARMTWSLGPKADERQGATWFRHLQGWTSPETVLADAGTGLQAGIAAVPQRRLPAGQGGLEHGLDVFPTILRRGRGRIDGSRAYCVGRCVPAVRSSA